MSNKNLAVWVGESVKKMTNLVKDSETLDEKLDVLVAYKDRLRGAQEALTAFGATDEEAVSVQKALSLIESEKAAIEARMELEDALAE